jgi:chromosomal replication initiator protein
VATDANSTYNPLFIYGPSGLGKTHLVTAIKHEIIRRNPDKSVIYVTGEAFGNELIKAIDQRDTSVFHDKYRNADVLIVDDIQFFSGKERMQEEFFHTFNKLHSEDKQIVITSDKPPRDLKTLEERIRNRFEWGLIADISTPDFETRFAIIRRKAELLDLKIPDEVTEFIANRLKTNIRQLEGAVKKLKALKMLANSSPTISMAQSVIRDILTDDQPIPITVEKVIAEVANVYGITPEDIRSSKRTSQISTARKVAAYVVREVTGMPLAAIGMEFGGRDHSTIVYAINNVTTALKKDANLKELVDDIIKDIREKNPNPPTA